MNAEIPSSRGKFETFAREVMAVLERHGFKSQQDPIHHFIPLFKRLCYGWLSWSADVSYGSGPEKIKHGLTLAKLDKIALECALILAKQGGKDVHYDDSLKHIRTTVEDILDTLGYENPRLLHSGVPTRWICYKLWEEIAGLGGMSMERIQRLREHARREHPQFFEESHQSV